eukprot:scaffold5152_cov60-Attheya_sp.AAC.10
MAKRMFQAISVYLMGRLILLPSRLLADQVNLLLWTCTGFWAVYALLRPYCYDASIITAVTIDVLTDGDGWLGVGFVDISLVEAPAVKSGGCGACWKGRNGGKRDETVFWGDTKPVVVCGAVGWRKRVDW